MAQATQATKSLTAVEALRNDLKKMEGEFKVTLPSHIPAEKFIRAVQTAVQLNPDLASADRRVLFGELMKCAVDGLIPDGREAVINVYAGTPKYNPMVSGLCKRARNSGEISTIDSAEVCENDIYEAWVDEKGQHFKHVRAKNRGDVILTYAYAITKDGGFYFEEVSEDQMKHIEEASRAKTGPWKGHFKGEMRRKSALRRLMKFRLPSSSDLDQVVDRENDLFDHDHGKVEDAQDPARTRSPRLTTIVESQSSTLPSIPAEVTVVETDYGDSPI